MKNLLYIFLFIFFGCNHKKSENTEPVLEVSTVVSEEKKTVENHQPKTLFDLIHNKKETTYNLPKDFDFSKNYTEKELKALDLDPVKIGADEYYFLSEQDFLEEDIKGLSFQIYYRHFYGNQLEKILRVQRTDTGFDITLAGKYSNGSDDSTLSTEFRRDNNFREVRSKTQMIKDDPNFMAYYIDSVSTFYYYNDRFDLTENTEFSLRYYKEIKENPETGKRDTLFEMINSLGKIQNTEFLYGISYVPNFGNLPETITIYSKNKNEKTRLETIEANGAYIDDVELFTNDKNHFIEVRMMETSGNSYSYFYAVDMKKMVLSEVEQDYGNFKLPDSLSIYKGYGITKQKDNKFTSGSFLRSENGSVKEYYLENEHKMIKENNKFVLKCISTEITPTDY